MSEYAVGPRRRTTLMQRLVLAPLRGWALIGFGIWNAVLWSLVVTSGSLISSMGLGLLLLPVTLAMLRGTANAARRLAKAWGGVEIEEPYRPLAPELAGAQGFAGRLRRLLAQVSDPQTWRDFAWAILDSVVGVTIASFAASMVIYGVYGFVLGILWPTLTNAGMNDWYTFVHVSKSGALTNLRWATFPIGAAFIVGGAYAGPALIRLHGRWTAVLLGPTPKAREAALNRRVARLTETRADAVDTQAAELRRIERDLHDGAQARLVALGMSLRAAERMFASNPEAALALVTEARETSSRALTDLRDLVRGIYPPVLADRGLADAVRALALDTPLHTELDIDLGNEVELPVGAAVYFAVAEVLANAVRHSGARTVRIHLGHSDGLLRAEITDDGAGGADPAAGTGLTGVERRLATFDGILAVSSPPGGPTIVVIEVPCALSSAKTSSC
jgi:signal transduction histidine kinase